MSVLTVKQINDYFFARISDTDIPIKKARKIGIASLIADNTKITELSIAENKPENGDSILEGLKCNTTLKSLKIGSLGTGLVQFPNCGVKCLEIDYITARQCYQILYCTTLDSLIIRNLDLGMPYYMRTNTDYFWSFVRNFKVKKLCMSCMISIQFSPIFCENIFMNENIKSLTLSNFTFLDFISEALNKNTTLESLAIYGAVTIPYKFVTGLCRNNISIIDFKSDDIIGAGDLSSMQNITLKNRTLRWNYIHAKLLNLTIVFYQLECSQVNIPPYVLLEIFDWIYPDNIYSRHHQKINLIINVYRTIKKLKNQTISA